MKNKLTPLLLIIAIVVPFSAHSKIPDSLLKRKNLGKHEDIYNKKKKEFLKKGYKKNFFGLDLGYKAPHFFLEEGKTIYISPIRDLTGRTNSKSDFFWNEAMRSKLAKLLRETLLFKDVYDEEKQMDADLIAEISILGVQSWLGYLSDGSECIWDINLYNKKGELLLSGFDKITSESFSSDINLCMKDLPILALLFICRNNDAFNNEYNELMRAKKLKSIRD